MLQRYAPPSKYDHLPQGCLAHVSTEKGESLLYIQISPDSDMPHWIRMGDFLERVFKDDMLKPEWIHDCLARLKLVEP